MTLAELMNAIGCGILLAIAAHALTIAGAILFFSGPKSFPGGAGS